MGWGSKAVADLLLVNDAELNAKDREGHTPLHYAARDNTDVAELLRQHGGHE